MTTFFYLNQALFSNEMKMVIAALLHITLHTQTPLS